MERVKQATLLEAKQAVEGLLVTPSTCQNPGEVLTKTHAKQNGIVQSAVHQIDQLAHHHFPGDSDDDLPF